MKCVYRVKLNNKEESFDSEKLVDNWVAENFFRDPKNRQKLYEKFVKGRDFIFDSPDVQTQALEKINQITEALKHRPDAVKRTSSSSADFEYDEALDRWNLVIGSGTKYEHLIGATDYINTAGNRKDVNRAMATGTDDLEYETIFKDRVEEDMNSKKSEFIKTNGQSDATESAWRAKVEARKKELWEKYLIKRELAQKVGQDIHSIMEVHANERMGKKTSLRPGYVLTTTDQQNVFDDTKAIFDEVINKYHFSKNAIFLPEFEIFSDHIDGPTKRVLKEKLGKDFDGVLGRIDLLVIDQGKAYVFDFKTTAEKEVGDWMEMDNKKIPKGEWVSSKKVEAMEQIALYLAILETWGIEAGSGEVVPITVTYNNDADGYPSNIKLKDLSVDGRSIRVADSSNDHTNIASLKLDRSTEKWDEIRDSRRRSSTPNIMHKYLPAMRATVSEIAPLVLKEIADVSDDMRLIYGLKDGDFDKDFQVTVDFYLGKDENGNKVRESRIRELASDDPKRHEGFTHVMYISPKIDMGYGKGQPVFFKSDDESEVRPILEKYCEKMNESLQNQYHEFAKDFRNIYQVQGQDESFIEQAFESFLGQNKPSEIQFLRTALNKYMTGGWTLYGANDPNSALIQNGVFIFHNNENVEIVMLTHDSLHYTKNFGTKRRPLKSITNGLSQEKEDGVNILSSQRGNFILMKALDIVSKDPNILRNGELKLQNVKVINPWHKTESWTDNDTLYNNWTRLCSLSNGKLTPIAKSSFVKPVDAAISEAHDILYATSMWGHVKSYFDNTLETEAQIIKLINIIKSKDSQAVNEDGTANLQNVNGYAIYCLYDALRINRKLQTPLEHDRGAILQGGALPIGSFIQNAGASNVTSIRMLDKLSGEFRYEYSRINNDRIDEMKKRLEEIYKECGYNPNTMSRGDFWKQFFVKENRRVSKSMKIINFSDPFWNGKPKSKVAFKYILDTLAQYKGIKITNSASTYEQADIQKYYEIPLSKGKFLDAITENALDNGIKGVADVVKKKISNFVHTAETFYFGDEELYGKIDKDNKDDLDLTQALTNRYCIYTDEQRAIWCNDPTTVYSTDLEAILGTVIAAQSVADASQTYGYLYAAMKTAINANELFGGEKIPEIKNFVSKYIDAIYKGRNIMDPSLQFANKVLGEIKKITSGIALGFNTRAFTREMLVSLYTGFLRAGNSQLPGITAEDFAFGMMYVLKSAPANLDKKQIVGQLNRKFGLVGQGRDEIGKSNYISDFGLRTVDLDNLAYLGTTIPDNYYRVAIAIAQLHGAGCFDAYQLDEHGFLKYDARKDNRFSKYLTDSPEPVFKEWDPSMGSAAQYSVAQAKWNAALEEWRTLYPDENIISLPEAFTPSEIRSVQSQCGRLYGYFDSDQKSLMTYQFIGSAIMQYKTWLSAKIDQWLKNPGFTNIWQQVHKKDINGNPLYILSHTQEEIESGLPPIEFITESQITPEMLKSGNVVPYIVQEGMYSEGMVQSVVDFTATLISMGPAEFLNMWRNDPVKRGNFICSVIDMWGMMLFAGLINLIFGDDVKNNRSAQNWITQWTYGVLMGMAEDGPIHQVLGSMVGDWNPPSLLTLQRMAQTTQSVLTGTKSLPEGFVQTFGATRELTGFFKQY